VELSNNLKRLHNIETEGQVFMATGLGIAGASGYWLGTFIARRMRFIASPRKFAIARVGMISLLSWVRLLDSFLHRTLNRR
jgi:hypothetical protein